MRPKPARAKRRGHVQQYSTGGGANAMSETDSVAAAQPPPMPPLAAIPRPQFVNQSQGGGNMERHESQNSNQSNPAFRRRQSTEISFLSRVLNSSHISAPIEQQAGAQEFEQRDPWDEEIGDIPWEDDMPAEPLQEPLQAQKAETESEKGTHNAKTSTQSHVDPHSHEKGSEGKEELAELPWDEEESPQWTHNAHESEEPSRNYKSEPLPWEQPTTQHDQSLKLPWESSLDEAAPQHIDQEEWDANVEDESDHWNAESRSEQTQRLPWEQPSDSLPLEDHGDDFWDQNSGQNEPLTTLPENAKANPDESEQNNETVVRHETKSLSENYENITRHEQYDFNQDAHQSLDWDHSNHHYDAEHEPNTEFFGNLNKIPPELYAHESVPDKFPWEKDNMSQNLHHSFLDDKRSEAFHPQRSTHPLETGTRSTGEAAVTEDNFWSQQAQTEIPRHEHASAYAHVQPEEHFPENSLLDGDELPPQPTQELDFEQAQQWLEQPAQGSHAQDDQEHGDTSQAVKSVLHTTENAHIPPQTQEFPEQEPWPSIEESFGGNSEPKEQAIPDQGPGDMYMLNMAHANMTAEKDPQTESERKTSMFSEDADVASIDLSQNKHSGDPKTDVKRAKALELLDMDDDLLLDDDFLDSDPETQAQPTESLPAVPSTAQHQIPQIPAETKAKLTFASKYAKPAESPNTVLQYTPQTAAPSRAYAPPPTTGLIAPTAPVAEPVVAPVTKKNDAYDFPLEFATQKVKPATRASLTNFLPHNAAPAGLGPATNTMQQPVMPEKTTKKPFFEDLPVSLPKPANKAKRAAAAATSASPTIPQPPSLPSAQMLLKKLPQNPYAKLAPKAGLAALQPQLPMTPAVPSVSSVPGVPVALQANQVPTKYQPSGAMPPPQQAVTPAPVPTRVGVVPPGANLSTGNMGSQPMGGQQVGQQYGPVASTNQYAPMSQNQYNSGPASNNHYGQGSGPGNQPNAGTSYGPGIQPVPANQYGLGHAQGNQYGPGPIQANQYAPGPVPGNQFGPGPIPGNQQGTGSISGSHHGPVLVNQYASSPGHQFAPASLSQQHSQQSQMSHNSQMSQNGPDVNQIPQIGVPQLAAQSHPAPQANRAPRVNTNVGKGGEKSSLSPYVPDTGPYGPSARTHLRTNSLMGGNAREGNPYAPAPHGGMTTSPNHALAPVSASGTRKRGKSNARLSLPTIAQAPERVENPEALLRRQFPIFSWGVSDQAVCFMPQPGNGFELPRRLLRVAKVSEIVPRVDVHADFPGPLSKAKTKRKDIESWLEKNIARLRDDYSKVDELLLSELLYALVQNDGEFTLDALHRQWASILTPSVDFAVSQEALSGFSTRTGPGLAANAFRLDNAGMNTVWAMIQAGNRDAALQFAVSKLDWALALIIAQSLGPDTFSKVSGDYARITFPFQTNQNTRVQHLMPLLLKIFAGNARGVIDDLMNVPSEGEFARTHYREIVSAAIINGASTEFLVEFGHFLGTSGLTCASELCFMLAGLILSRVPLKSGAIFALLGLYTLTSVYSEIYEHVLAVSSVSAASIPPTGLPDLLTAKIKRAQVLADMGFFAASRKYCDHIGSVMKTLGKSPFVLPAASADFKCLLVRLSDCSSSDAGWLGSKLSKVNLDKVWGQLDKFIGGDDSSAKPGEKGVFSKFSPNISRKSSMLDVTALGVNRAESYMGQPAEMSSPSQRQSRPAAPQKFATSVPNQANSQPLLLGAPVGRYHPQNGLLSSVNLFDSTQRAEPPQVHPVMGQKLAVNARTQIYSNRAAQLSSLSVASQHVPPQNLGAGLASPAKPGHSHVRDVPKHEPAHVIPASSTNGHSRTSSHLSDTFDPARSPLLNRHERRSSVQSETRDIQGAEENSLGTQTRDVEDSIEEERIEEEMKEKERNEDEMIEEEPMRQHTDARDQDAVPESTTIKSFSDMENGVEAEPIPAKIASESQETVQAPAPPPTVSPLVNTAPRRANPYAPKESNTNIKGINRYGPGVAARSNRYKLEAKPADANLAGLGSSTPFSNVFDDTPVGKAAEPEAPTEKPNEESAKEDDLKPSIADKENVKDADVPPHSALVSENPQTPHAGTQTSVQPREKQNPYAPPAKSVATNVDISFDAGINDDTEEPLAPPRAPLLLNGASPPNNFKQGYVNPYQEGRKTNTDMPIQNGFDEFPIPGSPEYTTRANSVIGHAGLYSSRLSQSQQSALYQQYEVKDDTVLDYVPVPEENEEDDAGASSEKKAARKKDMADAKQKIQDEMSSRGGGQNAESGWFKGWLGNKKNDDKPKPIRAKLGKANTFKYDETHKRWIDSSRPLEEQLKEAAPPPPPKKKLQAERPQREAPAIAAPAPMRGPSAVPSTIGGRRSSVTKTPSKPLPEPAAPKPNLANAGLDDLLNMNSANKGPAAASRRGKRRYVNVMEK